MSMPLLSLLSVVSRDRTASLIQTSCAYKARLLPLLLLPTTVVVDEGCDVSYQGRLVISTDQEERQSMYREEEEDKTIYKVVVNHEEQYSIWWADRENPLGWRDVGKSGLKPECLAYIKEVWTDMRPLSLRKQMEEAARQKKSSQAEEF